MKNLKYILIVLLSLAITACGGSENVDDSGAGAVPITPVDSAPAGGSSGPPVISAVCSGSFDQSAAYSCVPIITNPVSGLTYEWSFDAANNCSWASINSTTGAVSGIPGIAAVGSSCSLKFKVTDGSNVSAVETESVTITSSLTMSVDGITGGTDNVKNAFLTNGSNPVVNWTTISDVSYKVSILNGDGSPTGDVDCEEKTTAAASYNFIGCDLTEGQSYKAKVYMVNASEAIVSPSTYVYDFTVDTIAPPDPVAGELTLYSANTSGNHSSLTVSPDIHVTYAGVDLGTGIDRKEYRIIKVSDSSVALDWTSMPGTAKFRATGLTGFLDNENYRVEMRVIDVAGNMSAVLADAVNGVYHTEEVASHPFSGLAAISTPTLVMDGTSTDATTYTELNPYSAQTLTLQNNISMDYTKNSAIILRAGELVLSGAPTLKANGENATIGYPYVGGNGASGGGGGSDGWCAQVGAAGGSGSNGASGTQRERYTCGHYNNQSVYAAGGVGNPYTSLISFNYGLGGNGGNGNFVSTTGGLGGNGVNGAGGGGGGASSFAGAFGQSGGGGGGAGLVIVVADSISDGAGGAGSAVVEAKGGNGQNGYSGTRWGGGGGGGVIWMAFKAYDNNFSANVSGGTGAFAGTSGTKKIYQTNSDGSLTERAFGDTWAEDGVVN